jgi:hypothetical protein
MTAFFTVPARPIRQKYLPRPIAVLDEPEAFELVEALLTHNHVPTDFRAALAGRITPALHIGGGEP